MYSEPGDVNALGNHHVLPKTFAGKLDIAVHNTASPETFGTGSIDSLPKPAA